MNGLASSLGEPIAVARQLFGASTAVWAESLHLTGEHSWISLSGSRSPDYNLALVHGGDVATEVSDTLKHIADADAPSIVMLAGEGLAGAQVLVDAGWVAIGSMPFMTRNRGGWRADDAVRELTEDDLDNAVALAADTFGLGKEMAGRVFSHRLLADPRGTLVGLFEDGELVSCGLMCRARGVSTGWALATKPGRRRGGYATRLIGAAMEIDHRERGTSYNCCLASPSAKPFYDVLGLETVEYWQTWSRPRWILGGS